METMPFNSQAPLDLEFVNTSSIDSFENSLWAIYNRYASLDDIVDITTPTPNCFNGVHNEGWLPTPETLHNPLLTEVSSAQIPWPPLLSSGFHSHTQRQYSKSASSSTKSSMVSRASIDEDLADKHARKRDRNRISARRCRQKTKRKLVEKEEQIKAMRLQHGILMKEVKELQYELIATQVECMKKISCGCSDMKQALSNPVNVTMHSTNAVMDRNKPVMVL